MELESKFIEGFNKQYSIRNDGVVISHYRYKYNFHTKDMKLTVKDRIVSPYIDKTKGGLLVELRNTERQVKRRSVVSLVVKYFPLPKVHHNHTTNKIVFLDGDITNCSITNLKYTLSATTVKTFSKEEMKARKVISAKTALEKRINLLPEEERKDFFKIRYIKKLEENTEKVRKEQQKNGLAQRTKVTKSYVSSKLKLKVEELSEELYEAAKTRILIKRKLKQLQDGRKESQS